jgi:hypothetical protein
MQTQAGGSSRRRERTALELAASVFLVWHVAATTVGAAVISRVGGTLLHLPIEPYSKLFHLEPPQGFVAPDPRSSQQVRVRIEYHRGLQSESSIVEERAPWDPAHVRYAALSSALSRSEPKLAASAAHWVCKRHRAAPPARVTFVFARPVPPAPRAYELRHQPLDAAFIERDSLAPVYCP